MKNKHIAIIISFLLLSVAALCFVRNANENRVDISCFSAFKKNTGGEDELNVFGEMLIRLTKDGTGTFYINASSSSSPVLVAKRTYYFHYKINDKGTLNISDFELRKNPLDNVDDETFIQYFQNLRFKSSGNLTISKFRNIYVIRYPGFTVHTCSPV